MSTDPLIYFRQLPGRWNCAQSILLAWKDEFSVEDSEIETFSKYGGGRAPDNICGALFASNYLIKKKGGADILSDFEKKLGFTTCQKFCEKRGCDYCVLTGNALVSKFVKSNVVASSDLKVS